MKFDAKKLAIDLDVAHVAAMQAIKGVKDDGTCNFDSAILRFPRLRRETVESVGGLRKAHRPSEYFVDNVIGAQAAQRTIQAETICKIMKERGYDASVFYMMD